MELTPLPRTGFFLPAFLFPERKMWRVILPISNPFLSPSHSTPPSPHPIHPFLPHPIAPLPPPPPQSHPIPPQSHPTPFYFPPSQLGGGRKRWNGYHLPKMHIPQLYVYLKSALAHVPTSLIAFLTPELIRFARVLCSLCTNRVQGSQ